MSRLLRLLLSIGLLALVVRLADWRAVVRVLATADVGWITVAVALAVADRLVLNYRWQVLLAARGVLIGFARLFRVQLTANFLGSFLPSSMGVDAVRIATLCRAGEPSSLVIAATLLDRASILVATFLFGSVAILLLAQQRVPPGVERIVLIATAVLVALGALIFHPWVRRSVRTTLLPRLPERAGVWLSSVADAFLAFRKDGSALARVAGSTILLFAIRILFAKALSLACGASIPLLDLMLILPILWILVMLPISVGALGIQDAGYVALLALVGVSAPVAVGMSLIEHVVTRVVSLPGAFLIDVGPPHARSAKSSTR